MKNKCFYLSCYLIAFLLLFVSLIGIFYTYNGTSYETTNLYGDIVIIFNDGIYAFDTLFKAGGNKGTDTAVLIIIVPLFIITTILYHQSNKIKIIHASLLVTIMYYASCLCFIVMYNQLFLAYIILFSLTLYTLINSLNYIFYKIKLEMKKHVNKGASLIVFLGGLSVFVWFIFIIESIILKRPPLMIATYTTEPTFVFDLAIIFPISMYCAVKVFKKEEVGYKLALLILPFLSFIGLLVISQTLFQLYLGVAITIEELIAFVFSFILLSIVALIQVIRLLKNSTMTLNSIN